MFKILNHILKSYGCKTRFYMFFNSSFELTDWGDYFIIPTDNYLETPMVGPIEMKRIQRIEINPMEEKYIGRLVPSKKIDHTKEIIRELKLQGINFNYEDELISIENNEFDLKNLL